MPVAAQPRGPCVCDHKGAAGSVRLLVVAADDVLGQAVQLGFADEVGAEVAVAEPSASGISQAIEDFRPDVVMVWLQGASDGDADLIQAACAHAGRTPVLVLADDLPREAASALLVPGIAGYILTAGGMREVARALQAVVAGGLGAGGMGEALARFRLGKRIGALPPLNERQEAILSMICEGLSYRQIASRLFVSPSLVRKEVRRLLDLARARNRVELMARMSDPGQESRPAATKEQARKMKP